jgi:hypothetical protein
MKEILIMLIAVFVATLGVHLQLWSAITNITHKVAQCPKCSSFWLTLAVLLYQGCDIIAAIALSIVGAYIAHYVGLIFVALNKLYDKLWQKLNKWQ